MSLAATESAADDITFKILVTTDIHGWMNPAVNRDAQSFKGGLTRMSAAWRAREGYDPAVHRDSYPLDGLVLDCGDMWTGRAESTLLQGSPLIEAFNTLAYDATVVGNHEFDFGQDVLRRNARQLRVPMLAANLNRTPDGPALDFCQRSLLVNVRGIPIGIIGLANEATPRSTYPIQVRGLVFGAYEPAVRAEAQDLLARGARWLIVIAHVNRPELRVLAENTADLPIRFFFGGHDHARELEVLERDSATAADDVVLLSAGQFGEVYGRVEVTCSPNGEIKAHSQQLVVIEGSLLTPPDPADAALEAIADRAKELVAPQLGAVVGYAAVELSRREASGRTPLGELVTDSWLERFPAADVALNNRLSIRQLIARGPVTLGDVLGALPFASDLVELELSADQLRELLARESLYASGVEIHRASEGDQRVVTQLLDRTGQPLNGERKYKVITTDFLYLGGDGLKLKEMDPQGRMLGINYRTPFVELLGRQGASGVSLGRRWLVEE